MEPFDPKDIIDRKTEQELFAQLLTFTSPARMLIISDQGGRGKSVLLKRLVYNCRWVINPPVPTCLIELDRLQDQTPYQFVTQIVEELKIPDQFAKFQELETAWLSRNHKVFGLDWQMATDLPQAKVGTEIGAIAQLAVSNPGWTPDHEKLARQKCVEAFFEDLRAICATQPVVLLLDSWERCNREFRDRWIVEELLANHCFHPNKNLRPDKLIIVVAGRPYNPSGERQGLHDGEFSALFNNEREYEETVIHLRSLSAWDKYHVREFLMINGIKNPHESDIDFIQTKLKEGWSLEKVLTVVSLLGEAPSDD